MNTGPIESIESMESIPSTELDVHDLRQPLLPGVTLIEASAGTGKTYTVAALVLRLILEHNLAIDEILVTTFTIPATAELRDRIRKLLRTARDGFAHGSSDDPLIQAVLHEFSAEAAAMRARLTQALHSFDEAAIYTIHGFCQRMLADRAFESGAPFEQEFVANQDRLVREIAEDYWRRHFYVCDPFVAAAALDNNLSPASFERLLKLRLNHPLAEIIPPVAAGEVAEIEATLQALLPRLRTCWHASAEEITACFLEDPAWAIQEYAKPALMQPHLAAVAACLAPEANPAGFASLTIFAQSAIAEGTGKRHQPPRHAFFTLCEELKTLGARFHLALQHDFLHWAPAELERLKLRRNVLSFSDLLTQLHAGLVGERGPALAQAIRGRFRAALIDEFQDTDALQDEIFRRIFADPEAWLFLIGDPKQAIYGFRSADVFTYLRAAERAARTFTLGTNYRSATALVAATNHFFEHASRPFVLDRIHFHRVHAHHERDTQAFSGDGISAPLRIWASPEDGSTNLPDARRTLVATVAAEISRLLQGSARLGARPVVPADIAVLTATNQEAQDIQAALGALGISGVLLSSAPVFKTRDASEVFTVLTAIARPRDETRLRAALFTDLLGVTSSGLHALAGNEIAWEQWLLRFAQWHELWNGRGFIQMFRHLLLEAGIRTRLLARPDGERRLTNLLHLSELLQQAAAADRLPPEGLVKWLDEQIRDPQPTVLEEHEIRLERDGAAVRLITMHKSKGLEFNIVFCPFLWVGRDETGNPIIRFHDESPAQKLTLDLGSPAAEHHRELAADELLAGNARLLYVALTRARQRCDFVWGRFKNYGHTSAAWLLHRPPNVTDPIAASLAAHAKQLSAEQWRADLAALEDRSQGTIKVVDLPEAAAPPYTPAASTSGPIEARIFTAHIERDWTVSSFSSLSQQTDSDSPDRDPQPVPLPETSELEPTGIHAFPAGTRAGVCLHEILQELDFSTQANLDPLLQRKLSAFSFDPTFWRDTVKDCLLRTLSVTLAPGFTLRDVDPARRLVELEFHLPARHLEASKLRAILGADDSDRLDFSPRRGWLKGFIDLVFAHDGRYYIADWKSNRLGTHGGAYTQPALAAAMAAHHYPLQYHLYTVALHRYLGSRLPDYDYERHFGGVFYFFLRGIDPAQPDRGIVYQRPDAATIQALDHWLT